MLIHITLIAEIWTALICIHYLYGRKLQLTPHVVIAFLSILTVLEIINVIHLNKIYSLIVYLVVWKYCQLVFKASVRDNTVSLILYVILTTALQFVCVFLINMFIQEQQLVQNTLGNVMVLLIYIGVGSRFKLHKLQLCLCKSNKLFFAFLGFMLLVISVLLVQEKLFYRIQTQYFIFAVPSFFVILYLMAKLHTVQNEMELMKQKTADTNKNEENYEVLMTTVRMRQHEMKNHIEAVFSAHYTYDTYEKLVRAQKEYCMSLLEENKYTDLLMLGSHTLTGFLYGKFQNAENDGICVKYNIFARMDHCSVPAYYMIEMVGILFDNATEALKNREEKELFFEISESPAHYMISIRNPFCYVPHEKILNWFRPGQSEKGPERGLGLYHLKCLCEEWHCDIICQNIEQNAQNWISFTLKVNKADNRSC